MTKKYQLAGFSSGEASGPHFIEPVFTDGNGHFVQVASKDGDTVSSFAPFNEKVDLHEGVSEDVFSVGDRCTFAVVDNGSRLIYGDREYVSRYLWQNMRSYIDTPYFLSECAKFTGRKLPEFQFVNSKRDLLELAVAVNSIRDFAKSKPDIRRRVYEAYVEKSSGSLDAFDSSRSWGNSRTIFGAWRDFALENNHVVAKSARWGALERDYLTIYDDDVSLANRVLPWHLTSCSQALANLRDNSDITDNYEDITWGYLSHALDDTARDHEYSDPLNLVAIYAGSAPIRRRQLTPLTRWVSKALRDKKSDPCQISIQIYFISIVLKVTIELEMIEISKSQG